MTRVISTSVPQPPSAPGLPVLGNALDMMFDPLRFLVRSYQQLGPVFRVKALFQDLTVLVGIEAHQLLIRQEEELFSSDALFGEFADEIGYRENLVTVDGEKHRHLRRIMRPGFSKDFVIQNLETLLGIADQHLTRWQADGRVVLLPAVQRLVMHQLGVALFGVSAEAYVQDITTFVSTNMHATVMKTAPRLLLHLPSYQKSKRRFHQLAREIVAQHRAVPPGEARRRDLVDDMMDSLTLDGRPWDEGMLISAAVSPYIAGQDTVASTLAFMLYAVLKHPQVREQVQTEVDAAFNAGGPTAESLRNMPTLHGAAMETLRMYPVAFALPRRVIKAFDYGGYTIEPGTTVMIGTGVTHFLPEYFPNPEVFDVTRYSAPRKASTFNPYGLGAHTCLGAGAAEVQIALNVATILHRLDVELDPPDYTLRIYGAPIPNPGRTLRLRVRGRRA